MLSKLRNIKSGLGSGNLYKDLDLEALGGLSKLPEMLLALGNKYPFFGDVCKA